jgi:hypothetical protein
MSNKTGSKYRVFELTSPDIKDESLIYYMQQKFKGL